MMNKIFMKYNLRRIKINSSNRQFSLNNKIDTSNNNNPTTNEDILSKLSEIKSKYPEFFDDLGIENSPIMNQGPQQFQDYFFKAADSYFKYLHFDLGFGCVSCIVLLNLSVKLFISLPIQVQTLNTTEKLRILQPDLLNIKDSTVRSEIMKKHKINSQLPLIGLIQLPFFIVSMLLIRNQCVNDQINNFTTGGILWFKDLTVADPQLIIPAMQLMLTMMLATNNGINNPMMANFLPVVKLVTVMSFPLLSMFPVGNLIQINSTLLSQLLVMRLLKSRRMINWLKIPKQLEGTKSERDYNERVRTITNIQNRLGKKNGIQETLKSQSSQNKDLSQKVNNVKILTNKNEIFQKL